MQLLFCLAQLRPDRENLLFLFECNPGVGWERGFEFHILHVTGCSSEMLLKCTHTQKPGFYFFIVVVFVSRSEWVTLLTVRFAVKDGADAIGYGN